MKKILVVEDEAFLRRNIKELLVNQGYEVWTASCQTEAEPYLFEQWDIDLYLLDVWLPDGDGFELCRKIRRHSNRPVLFLTACDDEESVVKGLNLGADDYVTKPFRTAELVSRIQANLRRLSMGQPGDILKGGELTLDHTQARAYKKGEDLGLSTIEYQLLQMLMNHAGMIVKRELLLEKLWDASGKYVEDNTLSVSVSRLRAKVGQEYIETIRGVGYRFTKSVYTALE